ncbi:Hint domain-containing protein [Azospirillum sp. HJ39]|uniref:Hint domain-containing protein n=1 Tax=Azospirillum sp. HJ39 TaxID=3159496 RepID=UPI003558B297
MPLVANGSEIAVNTTTTNSQREVTVTAVDGYGYFLAWTDNSGESRDTSGSGIRGQFVGLDGTTGADFFVNATTTSDQATPSVDTLKAVGGDPNNVMIVWVDSSGEQGDTQGTAIVGARRGPDGEYFDDNFIINSSTAGDQSAPSVAGLYPDPNGTDDGGFVVVWVTTDEASGDGAGTAVKARLFNAYGVAIGGEFLVNSSAGDDVLNSANPGGDDQSAPAVTALKNGGFVVVWQDSRGSVTGSGDDTLDTGIRAKIYDGSGNEVTGDFPVNTGTWGPQKDPQIAALSGGGFVIVWITEDAGADGSGSAVMAQIYDDSGNAVGSNFVVNTTSNLDQYEPSVAALGDGGFIVTWNDTSGYGDPNIQYEIRGQLFTADGTRFGSEFVANPTASGYQEAPVVAATSDGGVVVAWVDISSSTPAQVDIKAQVYTYIDPSCYLAGSLVYTDRGDVPVERLRIGDRVLTASGAYRPIRWIGRTTIPARLINTPEAEQACLPVIVRRDAVQKNAPSRDLYIAPWHAIVANGVSMPVGALINGLSIVQDDRVRDLVYYNVELETVDVIFVNHLPVLSLWPRVSPRFRFDNCDDYFARYPDGAAHDRTLTSPVPDCTVDDLRTAAILLHRRAKAGNPAPAKRKGPAMRKQARPAAGAAAFTPTPGPTLPMACTPAGAATVDIGWTAFQEMMRGADGKSGDRQGLPADRAGGAPVAVR